MKLTCIGKGDSAIYYIQKSVRIGSKITTRTVERLGTIAEIKSRSQSDSPLAWAKEYVEKLNLADREARKSVCISLRPEKIIDPGIQRQANVGYLFLKQIYHNLGLDKICRKISLKYRFKYDLNRILSMLIYSRIIYPSSKKSSLAQAGNFLEPPGCDLHQVYRGLEIIARESDYIQSELYKNSFSAVERRKGILYYDCTNFYFETEDQDNLRKYGLSKEHRPNPIVQMGLFMDADGIPLTFSVFAGNESEQLSMKPLEAKVIRDFGTDSFVVCTDAGLSSLANREFNNVCGRYFITTQSIKKLKGFLQDFCLADDGWQLKGSGKRYCLSQIDENTCFDKIFYKERWINESGLEQRLIVTYSPKYRHYQQYIRQRQVERAQTMADNPSRFRTKKQNNPARFVLEKYCTKDGELADTVITSLNVTAIENEEKYDGFYAVCTNLGDDAETIIRINKQRWEIEECFRIMKTELKSRPVYLNREDRISAHFMTCFIALICYRILEKKLDNKFSCSEIIRCLRQMNMLIVPGEGYIPAYTRTPLTDNLHEKFGFRTDFQIMSQREMRKILTKTKNKDF